MLYWPTLADMMGSLPPADHAELVVILAAAGSAEAVVQLAEAELDDGTPLSCAAGTGLIAALNTPDTNTDRSQGKSRSRRATRRRKLYG